MKISINNYQYTQFIDNKKIRILIKQILKKLGCKKETELNIIVTNDHYITKLNKFYLNHPNPTNVLAFSLSEGKNTSLNHGLLGDIVISVDTVWREANENRLDPEKHLFRLIIHGILHLMGYEHLHNKNKAQLMENLTEFLLSNFNKLNKQLPTKKNNK